MLLYYAMGGGLGHLVRAEAYLSMAGATDYKVITASPYAGRHFPANNLISIPRELENHGEILQKYMQEIIDRTMPGSVVIDTFPVGILGELNNVNWRNAGIIYLTRRMKWKSYNEKIQSRVHFSRTLILEPLEDAHMSFAEKNSGMIKEIDLSYPDRPADPGNILARKSDKEKWFIIHSTPGSEVDILLNYARDMSVNDGIEPDIFVISQDYSGGEGLYTSDLCPVNNYFPYADRLVSGCGFNMMKQAEPFRKKHYFIPFSRKYDDQFWRAEQAKKNG